MTLAPDGRPEAIQPEKSAHAIRNPAEDSLPPWEHPGCFRLDCQPHRGRLLWWLAAAGVACLCLGLIVAAVPLAVTTWCLAHHDLALMRRGLMDPSGEQLTRRAREMCIIVVVVVVIVTVFLLVLTGEIMMGHL